MVADMNESMNGLPEQVNDSNRRPLRELVDEWLKEYERFILQWMSEELFSAKTRCTHGMKATQ